MTKKNALSVCPGALFAWTVARYLGRQQQHATFSGAQTKPIRKRPQDYSSYIRQRVSECNPYHTFPIHYLEL